MVEHFCFVCNGRVEPQDRVERSFPNHGGVWVFVIHDRCVVEFEETALARFHEVALSSLGRPRTS